MELLFRIYIFIIASDLNGFISTLFGASGILSPIILALTLVLFFSTLRNKILSGKLLIFFMILMLFWIGFGSILTITISNKNQLAFDKIRYYFPTIFSILTIYRFLSLNVNINNITKYTNFFCLSLIVNCFFIIFSDRIGLNSFQGDEMERSSGLIASVNQAGVTSIFCQIFILFFILNNPLTFFQLVFCFILYGIIIYSTFLTFSKAALINTIFVFFFFLFSLLRKNFQINGKLSTKKVLTLIIIFISVLFFSTSSFISNNLNKLSRYQQTRLEEFELFLKGKIDEETTTGRSRIAEVVLDKISKQSFIGSGLGTYHSLHELGGLGTHNEFLLFLGEIGYLGLFLFMLFLFLMLYKSFQISNMNYRFLCFSLVIVLVSTSLVSHTIFFVKIYALIFAFIFFVNDKLFRLSNEKI